MFLIRSFKTQSRLRLLIDRIWYEFEKNWSYNMIQISTPKFDSNLILYHYIKYLNFTSYKYPK